MEGEIMKTIKKSLCIILCFILIALCFAGCSAEEKADTITKDTMLIAYTNENEPFIYTDDKGNLTGFDVEVISKIFKDIKNDYKNYQFVKVNEGYRVGEDVAYTDDNGNEYIAYIMVGGLQKNNGDFNKEFSFTENIIDNRVIAVGCENNDTYKHTFSSLKDARAGIVSDIAKAGLDKNSAIKNNIKSITEYKNADKALDDLKSGKIDIVIIDEFSFNSAKSKDGLYTLNGEIDKISYVYSFKKWDWYVDAVNEAIYELKSPDYNDADEFTPIVEKYFGYNASSFEYTADNK